MHLKVYLPTIKTNLAVVNELGRSSANSGTNFPDTSDTTHLWTVYYHERDTMYMERKRKCSHYWVHNHWTKARVAIHAIDRKLRLF